MNDEYEDNESILGDNSEESHTFVTTYNSRKHRSAPLPEGAAERIKNELNKVEKFLNLTKTVQLPINHTYRDDFTETKKEQQARHVMETRFTMPTTTETEQLERLMDSSPLAKIANLKEENRQQRINN
jgi:hypothetical protein